MDSVACRWPDIALAMTRFESTRWSVVVRARGSTADAQGALNDLCRTYRPPVLAYIRGRGYSVDVAEDLAQGFFTHFVANACHASADPARGRFRAFLLATLKRFLFNATVEARALKRGGDVSFVPLVDNSQPDGALAETATPEHEFERLWALAVLDAAMRRLRHEAEEADKLPMFDALREFLTEKPEDADYARAAAALNMRPNTVAVAVHRMRHRLRDLVRVELLQTAATRNDLDAELRELRTAFARVMP
jgi:RNA polymerase sigma-70 factor (ECF subfamily)